MTCLNYPFFYFLQCRKSKSIFQAVFKPFFKPNFLLRDRAPAYLPCRAPITDESSEAAVVFLVPSGAVAAVVNGGGAAALVDVGSDGIAGNVQSAKRHTI